ncbi:MAG TPA: cytochrome c, partial [Acetobacteraceae bacterium]
MRAALFLLALLAGGPARADKQSFEVIEHGRALATIADCVACHTAAGGAPYAGGRPIETPFGVLVTPNLTPDMATGIGAWSDEEFLRALQTGIGRDGRHLYPAFPYPYYTRAATADLLAIRAYLGTLQPVRNPVVSNQLPFPFNIRLGMLAWNTLYFTPGAFKTDPGKSAEWNRGFYLVESLGHCGACHTAKTALGGDDDDHRLQGGIVQDWMAPALDNDPRTGLGAWSAEEIVEYLSTGRNARTAASGPMAEVVSNSTAQMPQADLRAIALYLKDQPAPAAPALRPL